MVDFIEGGYFGMATMTSVWDEVLYNPGKNLHQGLLREVIVAKCLILLEVGMKGLTSSGKGLYKPREKAYYCDADHCSP